jgi:hypothetical protein
MGRVARSAIAGLILGAGMPIGTWAIFLLVRGIRGVGESPGLYIRIGSVSVVLALLLISAAAFMLWALVSSGRAARRET